MISKVSPVTVRRDWSSAKIWLYRELTGETDEAVLSEATALGLQILRKPLKAIQLRALLTSPAQGAVPGRASVALEAARPNRSSP